MLRIITCLLTIIVSVAGAAEEIDLSSYENFIYSAHGEDGIIARIFEFIEPNSLYCVDIGAGDGITGSNTYLLRIQGWDCALFDRKHESPQHKLYKEFINADNLNEVFKKHRIRPSIDLLSINNYNEFYIWKELDEIYKPSVVIIKYNASHMPQEDKVAKYRPYFCGDGTKYFGASISALYNLGRKKGYSLIYAEKTGMNLFFIRNDILYEKDLHFKNTNDVEKIYRSPANGNGSHDGLKEDPKNREYISSRELLN